MGYICRTEILRQALETYKGDFRIMEMEILKSLFLENMPGSTGNQAKAYSLKELMTFKRKRRVGDLNLIVASAGCQRFLIEAMHDAVSSVEAQTFRLS